MKRWLAMAFGGIAYASFLAIFCYLVGFLSNQVVARTVDAGGPIPSSDAAALAIDIALIALFGLQHSLMARAAFKQWWTRVVPESIERSTYVVATNAVVVLLLWQWRPIPDPIWHLEHPLARAIVWATFGLGIAIIVLSTFLIDHLELFGLRQVYDHWRGETSPSPEFQTPLLYKLVRHPMMVGVFIVLWATPSMTIGHAVFAAAMTAYLVIGVQLEERDLERLLGADYRAYKRRVPQLIPRPPRARDGDR